ncbi:hypothetical protein MNBD_NITROSPINAE01-1620 [hydrothermal vent metagenome]|uniref:Methyltransferase domain-containing protein n=1 Tax=hydrothermal vent metagenome TaxID=652676 RepID=A0A3B1C0Z8_9ZZZZ
MSIAKVAHKIANIPIVKRTLTENRFFVRLFFNLKYRRENPYEVKTSAYEKEKYALVLKALDFKERFDNILEIGCGEGVMTGLLAKKTSRILGVDISDFAVKRAIKRFAGDSNVTIRRLDIFSGTPDEKFELLVCADVLYYFEPSQLPEAIERIIEWTESDGYILLAHVRASADDETGVELKKFGAKTIHELFIKNDQLSVVKDDVYPEFRLTVLQKKGL